MLVLIQDFVGAHMTGMQATLTANFAGSQVIHAPINPTSSNCAHAFLEAVSKYLEISRLCPVLCSDADLAITLGSLLDQLPEDFGSGLRFQIQMYKSHRESDNAADSDDDSASSTPRRLLLQSDLARALKEHDRSVRRKAEELQISTSIADLASKPAQTAQLADLQRQLKVLQERLATRLPLQRPPPSVHRWPPRHRRAPRHARWQWPPQRHQNQRARGPRTSDPQCATAHTATDGTWTGTAHPTLAPLRHRLQVGLPPPHLPRRLATSDPPPHPPRSPPPPSLPRTPRRIRPGRPHRRRSAPYRGTSRVQPYARRQITSARRPPRHFSPCFPGLFRSTPLRGIAPQTPGGITSRPCGCLIPGPRLRGAQPYASAFLEALLVGRPPPRANIGSQSHTAPPPRRHSPTPAIHGLQAAPHAPVSLPTCRNVWNHPHLRLANPLLHFLGRPRNHLHVILHCSVPLCNRHLCRRALHAPQDAQLRPG